MRSFRILLLMVFIQFKVIDQSDDLVNAPLFNATCISSFSATGCGATTYNLGASTSLQIPAFGTMSNDVWWRFEAPCELVKLKLCDPTFDAAIEVWASEDSMITSVNLTSNSGLAGKEYMS